MGEERSILEADSLTYRVLKSGKATDPKTISRLAQQKIRKYKELQILHLNKAEQLRREATADGTYGTKQYYQIIHKLIEFAIRCEEFYKEYEKLPQIHAIERTTPDGKKATIFYNLRRH